jgi:hypothetical protein
MCSGDAAGTLLLALREASYLARIYAFAWRTEDFLRVESNRGEKSTLPAAGGSSSGPFRRGGRARKRSMGSTERCWHRKREKSRIELAAKKALGAERHLGSHRSDAALAELLKPTDRKPAP